jgi:hypothetical protein
MGPSQHSDGEEGPGEAETPNGSGVGFSRPDQVFDLGMDYDDDDVLLDWEQYAGMELSLSSNAKHREGQGTSGFARFCGIFL